MKTIMNGIWIIVLLLAFITLCASVQIAAVKINRPRCHCIDCSCCPSCE